MNIKKIIFNYILENEKFVEYTSLNKAEENLTSSLTNAQLELFEKYTNEYTKYHTNRLYEFFCKGIKVKL